MIERIMLLLVGFALGFFMSTFAEAHEARTGWMYSVVCCSNQDCRHAEPGEVLQELLGYRIANTGELIPYSSKKILASRDVDYHLCQFLGYQSRTGDLVTRCLYVPVMF